MSTTTPFRETVLARAKRDPEFRAAMLGEALLCIAENDLPSAKKMLRDFVLASIGFEKLAELVGKKPESLMRMLSAKGNPTVTNLAAMISAAKGHEGVDIDIQSHLRAG